MGSSHPRRAMILAAGAGKRLRPLTTVFAKPALPVLGRPLIEYWFRALARQGIREVVVNLHHRPETLEASLERASRKLRLHRSVESELLGTAGGLKNVERFFDEGAFLLLNGDTLIDFDVSWLAKVHEAAGGKATLLLRKRPGGTSYSGIPIDDDGRILGIERRDGSAPLMFAGVWLLEPTVLGYLSSEPRGLEDELLPRLIEEGSAFGAVSDGAWITIDTPKRYWEACLRIARDGLFEADWEARRRPIEVLNGARAGVFAGGDARVEEGVGFSGMVILGARCHVKRGARLENVVCWDDVSIGADVTLSDTVVTHGVALPRGIEMKDKVILKLGADRSDLRRREIQDGLVVAELKTGRAPSL